MTKLTDVLGIGPVIAKMLTDHNIKTVEALASTSISELLKVPGFSEIRARTTIKAAADCLQSATRQKSTTANGNTQTIGKKPVAKKIVTSKATTQPEESKVKDKKKNKKDDKKKDKKKKSKSKGKGKNKS